VIKEPLKRLAVGIQYDGTAFAGWQRQEIPPRGSGQPVRTVQQVLEEAVGRVADEPVSLTCAGRTDAGVHARAQVAHFDTRAQRSLRSWVLGANTELPRDVSVSWVQPVPESFHARYSAQARTYRYHILNSTARAALAHQRATWLYRPLDHERMRQAAQHLSGEHDFSAFRAAECQSKSPVRRIERLTVDREAEWVLIEVTANAFLHHMVRNIAGLLIDIGKGKHPPEWAQTVLASRDRRLNAATAPADGLYLWSVRYDPAFGLPGADGPPLPPAARLLGRPGTD
jgi:tRNA pseudouridine38-40 synthase